MFPNFKFAVNSIKPHKILKMINLPEFINFPSHI